MPPSRSYTVAFTHGDRFAKAYPALARFPFILDSRPGYHRLGNQYLVDRALGLWGPKLRGKTQEGRIPSEVTMLNYAQWLANFLEWADLRSVDIHTCGYVTHIFGKYQKEMLEGSWSETGRGLSGTTVDLRVRQACEFLTWLADKGRRETFQIPSAEKTVHTGSATNSVGHLGKKILVRPGKVRPETSTLNMPTDNEVRHWLGRIAAKFGPTRELMCETILLTAMRREEVVSLRVDTLPESRKDWHVVNPLAPPQQQQVQIALRYGTKGTSYGIDYGGKIGPSRKILIPLTLALRWDEYRRTTRNKAFSQWMSGVKGAARRAHAQRSVHLFLRESDGARFKGAELYDTWTGVPRPTSNWSPHQGRHWWACTVLWRELKKHERIVALDSETVTALLESTAMSIIRLQIQPQLGHMQDSTTMIYLRWAIDMLSVPVSLDYEDDESNQTVGTQQVK